MPRMRAKPSNGSVTQLRQDNFAPAFYNLANRYRKGFGIDANKERAEALEKWAAEVKAECKEEIVQATAK